MKIDTTIVYDGNGNRVKKTEGGETVIYINQYYEKNLTTGVATSYYYLGGQLMAFRSGSTTTYIHQDHLGSTAMTTNSSGNQVSRIKYYPFGVCRLSQGIVATDRLFTGQRLDDTGLYYYNARYYDPTIGRFISADTIVPNFMDPQAFNRYSYCLNNPLRYIDPSGHGWPWDKVGNFCKGVGNAFVDTAKSTVQMVVNPVETAQALGHAITHPVETFNVIKDDYIERAGSAEGIGSICGEILIMAATSGAGSALGKGGKVAQLIKEAAPVTKTAGVVEKEAVVAKQLAFDFMKEPAFSGKVAGCVIGRTKDLAEVGALTTGEYRLGWLSVLGNPRLGVEIEKSINLSKLLNAMELRLPIRDATSISVKEGNFLQFERGILSNADWYYDDVSKYWMPPMP